MPKLYRAADHVRVPDGTLVSAFLNPLDQVSGSAATATGAAVSLAEGILHSGVRSEIHVLPLVTQIVYVLDGLARLTLLEATDAAPATFEVQSGDAVIVEAGTLLQLENAAEEQAQLLYICTPAYLYAPEGPDGGYDDAITLGQGWPEARARARALDLGALRAARARAQTAIGPTP